MSAGLSGRPIAGDMARPSRATVSTFRRQRWLGATVLALATLIGASCGCGADTATTDPTSTTGTTPIATDPPQTSTPTSSTTTAPTGDEAEVRALLDRYWDAWFIAASNPPDPTNAELNSTLTGEAAAMIIGGLEEWASEGKFLRFPANSQYVRLVTSVTFDERGIATVEECLVDDAELADVRTGATLESGIATLHIQTTLNRIPPDNAWRVTTTHVIEKSDGVASCGS